jgi:hypothetical protein
MFVERQGSSTALFTFLVLWHSSAVSLPPASKAGIVCKSLPGTNTVAYYVELISTSITDLKYSGINLCIIPTRLIIFDIFT